MERIRDAIERAREERTSHGSNGIAWGLRPTPVLTEKSPEAVSEMGYTATQSVPMLADDLREKRVVSGYGPCIFTDAFKILATQVSQRLRENHWNTLAVTSPRAGEGKSLVAINLAICLAMEFHRTALLVDADLRCPSVRDALGLPVGPGLSDYLLSDTPIEQMLVSPGIPAFVVLPGGAPQPNSSELLGSAKMGRLVQELRAPYASRIVVFDLPPLFASADVLAFAPHVEASLIVVEDGKTRRDDVARAAALLASTHVLGTVLNKSHELGGSVTDAVVGTDRHPTRRAR